MKRLRIKPKAKKRRELARYKQIFELIQHRAPIERISRAKPLQWAWFKTKTGEEFIGRAKSIGKDSKGKEHRMVDLLFPETWKSIPKVKEYPFGRKELREREHNLRRAPVLTVSSRKIGGKTRNIYLKPIKMPGWKGFLKEPINMIRLAFAGFQGEELLGVRKFKKLVAKKGNKTVEYKDTVFALSLEVPGIEMKKIEFKKMKKERRKQIIASTAEEMAFRHSLNIARGDPHLHNYMVKKDRLLKGKFVPEHIDLSHLDFKGRQSGAIKREQNWFIGGCVNKGLIQTEQELRLFAKKYWSTRFLMEEESLRKTKSELREIIDTFLNRPNFFIMRQNRLRK